MDIEEFLDRELSELDLGIDKPKTPETNEQSMQFGENFEPSALFDNIKVNLSKGNIEEAEQPYAQLWDILLQQKLKWNNEIYGQLLILSRQFLSLLNRANDDIKKKADYIYDLIKKARTALREGKKDVPFKIYSEIIEINSAIPNAFFEEKKVIQEQITIFYEELKSATDNELIKRVSSLVQETNQMVDRINLSIRSNDYANAIANYNKCLGLYIQMPEGFLRHKTSLGIRLLEIYKSLSIYTEISNLQKQISQSPYKFQQQSSSENMPIQKVPDSTIPQAVGPSTKSTLLNSKREQAKRNIEKGFYNEAFKNIEEALKLEPRDAESKAIHAKIKTLQ